MPTGQACDYKWEPRARRRLSQGFEKMIPETKLPFPVCYLLRRGMGRPRPCVQAPGGATQTVEFTQSWAGGEEPNKLSQDRITTPSPARGRSQRAR
jgi:hypothetical protein